MFSLDALCTCTNPRLLIFIRYESHFTFAGMADSSSDNTSKYLEKLLMIISTFNRYDKIYYVDEVLEDKDVHLISKS